MYSVYQHWDPLQVCIVGKTYPPEFYSWIKETSTRRRFEVHVVPFRHKYFWDCGIHCVTNDIARSGIMQDFSVDFEKNYCKINS